MNYTTRIRTIKILLNIQGILTIIAMFLYGIPIVISFKTNTLDMHIVTNLLWIVMATYFIYLFNLNKCLLKYNNISNLNIYKKYIKEMIYLLTALRNTKIEVSILYFAAILITYSICWWVSDVSFIEAVMEYLVLVVVAIINTSMIVSYINNFNVFKKRLYAEVYK